MRMAITSTTRFTLHFKNLAIESGQSFAYATRVVRSMSYCSIFSVDERRSRPLPMPLISDGRADDMMATTADEESLAPPLVEVSTGEERIRAFDGNILNFDAFITEFKSNINPTLSEFEKYQILFGKLNEKTRKVISKVKLADNPLTQAIARLEANFRKPYVVIRCLQYAVCKRIPVLKHSYDNDRWQELMNLAQQVEAKLLEFNFSGQIDKFAKLFVDKLPVRDQNRLAAMTNTMNLADFINYCRGRQLGNLKSPARPHHGPSEEPCPLCLEEFHHPIDCDVYDTVGKRLQQIYLRHLCYKCLKKYNHGHNCGRSCSRCNGPHNVANCTFTRMAERGGYHPFFDQVHLQQNGHREA